jgi:LPXTG-site transpeptidase (sortase) family protein
LTSKSSNEDPVAPPPKLDGYGLKIDKLSLEVPIVTDVDGSDPKIYLNALKSGIAHMLGTAKPGEEGNIVIFDHSSVSDAYKGKYGAAFSKLDSLDIGDRIVIVNQKISVNSVYHVAGKKVVSPSDTSLIQQNLGSRLTIITCWPTGYDSSRLIVWATPQ